MQTFLPYPDFKRSLECLDMRRLGKQRAESLTIIRSIHGMAPGWRKHPAVEMWSDYSLALMKYYNTALAVFAARGGTNVKLRRFPFEDIRAAVIMPWWFGCEEFHASHRSNLIRKDPVYYSQFGWAEGSNLPYVWPKRR